MIKILKVLSIAALSIVLITLAMIPINLTQGKSRNGAGQPLIIAHRGASGLAPENTLPAIDLALVAGSDYIEIDVHLSKDNAIIVMHDESVNRTTNGDGKIAEMTVGDIKKLDAGSWFGEGFKGTQVPLLEEVISHISGKAKLLIEIKKKSNENQGIEEKIIEMIREHDAVSWCEVQSFNDETLEIIHQKAPEIILHKLIVFKYRFIPYAFDGKITRFSMEKYHYVKNVNLHYRFVNKSLSKQIRQSGKQIFLWGCRDEKLCFPLDMKGYNGIITDYPQSIQNLLNCP